MRSNKQMTCNIFFLKSIVVEWNDIKNNNYRIMDLNKIEFDEYTNGKYFSKNEKVCSHTIDSQCDHDIRFSRIFCKTIIVSFVFIAIEFHLKTIPRIIAIILYASLY